MLQALFFDVDGTLADTESAHLAAFNHAFAELGLDWHWDEALYTELLNISGGKERILHYWKTTRGEVRELDAMALQDTVNRLHELIPGAALAGSVMYEGKDIYDRDIDPVHIRLQIGMVFQKPNPFPSMTIRGNVLSGLKLSGMKRDNHDDIVEQTLTAAGLWNEVKDRLNHAAGDLSGGQQQRLVIARALAVQPHVLLMDEPCSALDPASTLKIEETIRALSKDVTIIIVTHNMQQAVRVSDYTAFFLAAENEPGHVVEQGPTTEIFGNPQDQRTLDYVNGRFG